MQHKGELQGGQGVPMDWVREVNRMTYEEREEVRQMLLRYLRAVDAADADCSMREEWRRN